MSPFRLKCRSGTWLAHGSSQSSLGPSRPQALSTAFMRDEIRLPSEYERSAASRQPGPESATRRCACASFDACPASVRMAVCRARDGYAPPASGNAAPCAVAVVEPESDPANRNSTCARSEEHTSEL